VLTCKTNEVKKEARKDILGYFAVSQGRAHVRYFTTKPGGRGKPGNIIFYVRQQEVYPFTEIYDWKKIDSKLKGNHTWLKLTKGTNVGWTYAGSQGITVVYYKEPKQHLVSDVPEWLLSNEEFNFDIKMLVKVPKLLKLYKRNKLTVKDLNIMKEACERYNINPLVLITKMEQEQGLISNKYNKRYSYETRYAKACGVHGKKKNGFDWGFKNQVNSACRILRRLYDSYVEGKVLVLSSREGIVYPKNAATWALYRYCPHYGAYDNSGVPNVGNKIFEMIIKRFRKQLWEIK